jgi:DNA-binding CsgD family transcriptional regulator/tetratricopeptide (TPR) repeat protein
MGVSASQLHDREAAIETLDAALITACDGRGVLLIVEGAAGTGKSALLALARDQARTVGVTVLAARGGELERDHPFGLIHQLFERTPVGAQAFDSAADGFAAMRAIHRLTVQLASERPLLLAIDDVHWGDRSSLRALDFLARRLAGLPVAMLVALRPDEPDSHADLLDELRRMSARGVATGALGSEAVSRIVRERFPLAGDDVCESVYEATAGNPLYLEELLRSLRIENGSPDAETVVQVALPTLGDRVVRRVNRVAGEAPALARAMTVLGGGCALATAAQLAGLSQERAGRIAHRLRRIEILRSEDPVEFVHPLVARSIYDAIPQTERQSMHRRAAQFVQARGGSPAAIAAHLRLLRPAGEGVVARAMLAAAEQASQQAAHDEAIDWLRRALAEDAPEPARAELLARLGEARLLAGDPAGVADLQEAHRLATDPVLRATVALRLAVVFAHAGRWDAAIELIESVERDPEPIPAALRAELAAIGAVAMLHDPMRQRGLEARRAEYEVLVAQDSWGSSALAAVLAEEASHHGRPEEAVALARRALAGGRLFAERGAGGWASGMVIEALIRSDELGAASETVEELQAAALASGSTLGEIFALANRAWIQAIRGELDAAEAALSGALALVQEAGIPMGVTTLVFIGIDVLLERPAMAHIVDLVEGMDLGEDFMQTTSGGMLLEVRGRLRLQRRDSERGIADVRAAGVIFSALRFGASHSAWRSVLALALPAGEREQALELAREELALARPTGLALPQAIALRALGMLDGSAAGPELLRESVALLEHSQARLEYARSLVELGAALRRANRRAEAREHLAQGLRLAHMCGAEALRTRAEQELTACGGRRPRLELSGRESLTASELRVIELAAAGATNSEIAGALYVSLKTVETHLSRAYHKLGLSGRGSRRRLREILNMPASA